MVVIFTKKRTEQGFTPAPAITIIDKDTEFKTLKRLNFSKVTDKTPLIMIYSLKFNRLR